MNKEQYIQSLMPLDKYTETNLRKTMDYLSNYEERIGKAVEEGYTKEQYVAFFSACSRRSTTFIHRKGIVLAYVKSLVADGILPESNMDMLRNIKFEDLPSIGSVKQVEESGSRISMFKNFSALQYAIDKTLEKEKSEKDFFDPRKFEIAISIAYLAWFGLTEQQIIDLKKSDVTDDGVIVDGELVQLPKDAAAFLVKVKGSDGYFQKAKGLIFRKYVDSDYLIRTERYDHLEINKFRGMLSRLNAVMDKQYSLVYKVIHSSGVFFRAYMHECSDEDFDIYATFGSDLSKDQKFYIQRNYNAYKKLFA